MSKVTPNKPFPVTWPKSGVTLFLTRRAKPRKGRIGFAMKWSLQSSKPVQPSMSKVTPNKPFPETWPQSGVTFFLTCRARSRKGRTAFAMKWPLQSSKPVAATNVQSNPEQALSRGLAPIRGYFVAYLSGLRQGRTAFAMKWRLQSSKPVAAIHHHLNKSHGLWSAQLVLH